MTLSIFWVGKKKGLNREETLGNNIFEGNGDIRFVFLGEGLIFKGEIDNT